MIYESILNNVNILSSYILDNMKFLAHWETESVTAEWNDSIIVIRDKNFPQEEIFYVFMLQEYKKAVISSRLWDIWRDWDGVEEYGRFSVFSVFLVTFFIFHSKSYNYKKNNFFTKMHVSLD